MTAGEHAQDVPTKDARRIVHPVLDYDPTVVLVIVLLDLVFGKLFLWSGGLFLHLSNLVLDGRIHPARIICARHGWMAEHDAGIIGIIICGDFVLYRTKSYASCQFTWFRITRSALI